MADQPWISVHVFLDGDLDQLLVQGIDPLVRLLQEERAIKAFFFVRYWNGGPHVRLRLLPVTPKQYDQVRHTAVQMLQAYLREAPGSAEKEAVYARQAAYMDQVRERLLRDWEISRKYLEEPEPLQLSNTAQLRPYRYDADRYGRERARDASEELFHRSSEVALAVVSRTIGAPGARLALALRMMAASVKAVGLSSAEAAEVFTHYYRSADYLDPGAAEHLPERWGFLPYEAQREAIAELLDGSDDEQGSAVINVLLRAWKLALADCTRRLRQYHQGQQLTGDPWTVLVEYLHLMNNRLGIPVREELYLAYLLAIGLAARTQLKGG